MSSQESARPHRVASTHSSLRQQRLLKTKTPKWSKVNEWRNAFKWMHNSKMYAVLTTQVEGQQGRKERVRMQGGHSLHHQDRQMDEGIHQLRPPQGRPKLHGLDFEESTLGSSQAHSGFPSNSSSSVLDLRDRPFTCLRPSKSHTVTPLQKNYRIS